MIYTGVEFKSWLVYIEVVEAYPLNFPHSHPLAHREELHTEVGETSTPVGIVDVPYLLYPDSTSGLVVTIRREAIPSMRTELHHSRLSSSSTSFAIILCLSLGACSWVPKGDMQLDIGIKDRGVASWYGEQFHGRQAANGELFDMEALTAAHRTMPLGSVVRVVNLTNGKHLYVRITDRGPYEKGRILDLSHGAAVQLGVEHEGVAYVQVEIVGERRPELMLLSEQFSDRAASLLVGARPWTHRASPGMASPARNFLGDLWIARRNRWAVAMLAATHPAGMPVASLVLN
jgi:rare lipoprotein A